MKTIVAIYDDIAVARQVVEDLVDADFLRSSISLITNDANNQYSHYLDKDYTPRKDAVTSIQGAGFGAAVGGLTGVIVGLASLVPGIGLVIAAGPIAAGLTGILAGSVTGGIIGALVKSGVPKDESPYYAEGIRRGGTLVSVQTSDTLRAEDILNRYGSTNIHERINQWRQEGWTGFETPEEGKATGDSSPNTLTTVTTDTTTTRVTHRTRAGEPLAVAPLLSQEPLPDDEDTSKSFQVVVSDTPTDDVTIPHTLITDAPIPVDMTPEGMTPSEPDPPVLEGGPRRIYEYTADDFQVLEVIEDHPKG